MMRIPFVPTLSFLLASHAAMAAANDGVMGGAGSDLVPMKTADVSMVSEDIQLTYADTYWHVEADYVFRNNAQTPQKLQLGFPEYRCEADEVGCLPQRDFHFEEMTTLVRNAPVKHRKGRLKGDHAWAPRVGNVWLFDVAFAAGEAVDVRHTYRVPSSYDSSGGRATRYVTRTGALWAGPIDTARFRVRVPLRSVDFIGPEQLKRTAVTMLHDKRLAEVTYDVRDFSPDFDLSFYFVERQALNTIDATRPDLAPRGPAQAGLDERERCQSFVHIWELGYDKAFEHTGEAEARIDAVLAGGTNSRPICEATVYAKYGKRFEDDRLNRYFYGPAGFIAGEWPHAFMTPNPDFDPSWLGADDLATLELLKRLPDRKLLDASPFVPPVQEAKPPAAPVPDRGGCSITRAKSPVTFWSAAMLLAVAARAGSIPRKRRRH